MIPRIPRKSSEIRCALPHHTNTPEGRDRRLGNHNTDHTKSTTSSVGLGSSVLIFRGTVIFRGFLGIRNRPARCSKKCELGLMFFLRVAPPAPPGTPTQLGTRHRTDSSSERFLAELRLVSAFSVDFTRAFLLNMTRVDVIKYMNLARSSINPTHSLS